jgi:monovalent cation:H+ antiporter-2, CPA2 family
MENFHYLPNVVTLLFTAIFIVVVFRRLNLSPVLGYLVAGAALGQHGLSYVSSDELKVFAEFGIVFLLFAIGLELTLDRLRSMRWHVFGFGSAQMVVTATGIAVLAYWLGQGIESAIVIGGALALSSTAVVLRVITEDHAYNTQVGRLAIANLLLQDLAVVPLLVLVPLLANHHGPVLSTLGIAAGKAVLALFVIFLVGRTLLKPLFKLIASSQSNELFTGITLLVVLASSWATNSMGLSLAMGAFIAGLLVAETEYQHLVEETIMPFKDLLMGLFFMTIGMDIDMAMIYDKLLIIGGLSVALIASKALIIIGLSRLFGVPTGSAIHTGLLLAQGSEFAFILFGLASQSSIGLITPDTAKILLLVVTISMAFTPALSSIGRFVSRILETYDDDSDSISFEDITDLRHHVVIVGYNITSEMVAKLLEVKRINYIILEADSTRVRDGRKRGYPIYQGDANRLENLRAVSVERAKAAIVTVQDQILMKKVIRSINKHFPAIPIVVRSEDLRNSQMLLKIGASTIVPEKYESGLQLAGELLKALSISEFEISKLKNQFRASNYELTRDIIQNS